MADVFSKLRNQTSAIMVGDENMFFGTTCRKLENSIPGRKYFKASHCKKDSDQH